MIESLRTTKIAVFRFATPSGFLRGGGGAETRYKKYSCKGNSYETICENIVSRYQTLVPSFLREVVFLHRRERTLAKTSNATAPLTFSCALNGRELW